MTPVVSTKELSERMCQQWGPLRITDLKSMVLVQAKLRHLSVEAAMLITTSDEIQDLLRESVQLELDTE